MDSSDGYHVQKQVERKAQSVQRKPANLKLDFNQLTYETNWSMAA